MADYRMRAYHTVLTQHVFWVSGGAPDFTGASSGYTPGDLDDIVVQSVIPTTGTTPGTGGGDWEKPPMSDEPYAPPAQDMEANSAPQPPHPGFVYTGFMTEGDGVATKAMATQTQGYNVGDLTDLMVEFP